MTNTTVSQIAFIVSTFKRIFKCNDIFKNLKYDISIEKENIQKDFSQLTDMINIGLFKGIHTYQSNI